MKKFKIIFLLFFLVFTFIFLSMQTYSQIMFEKISNDFLRFHIVANSDSTEDQLMKYEIRDAVISYISPYMQGVSNKQSAVLILNNHISDIKLIAKKIIENHGYDYPVNISLCPSYFPVKTYGNITLPEGIYDALKIEIGESKGQNWWCVMYPCLCIIDSTTNDISYSPDVIKCTSLEDEEYSLISGSGSSKSLKFKFKLIELFENL